MKIATISMVKTSIEQLTLFVNYHLNIGIDHMILLFDDPLDKGGDVFSKYDQVHVVKCSSGYWEEKAGGRPEPFIERQVINVNEGVRIASSLNCDWMIHIDNDELVHPVRNIKTVLSKCAVDAVRFNIMEAVSDTEHYDHIFRPRLFRMKSGNFQIRIAKFLGCSNAFFNNDYFRGHMASKMAVKISSDIIQYHVHTAYKKNGELLVEDSKSIQLLHFDCVGIDDWMSKWDARINLPQEGFGMRNNRAQQLSLYIKAKSGGRNDLSVLFRRMHCIPKREKIILYLLGMLKVVSFDHGLFKAPVENK